MGNNYINPTMLAQDLEEDNRRINELLAIYRREGRRIRDLEAPLKFEKEKTRTTENCLNEISNKLVNIASLFKRRGLKWSE